MIVTGIVPTDQVQPDMFDNTDWELGAMDRINQRYGSKAISFAD